MTGLGPDNPIYDSAELDDLLDSAMIGILAKLEGGFDAESGLADIYARSGAYGAARQPDLPAGSAMPAMRAASTGSSRLAQVCDQVDGLSAWLSDLIRSAREAPFGGSSYLELARDSLVQLRTGLSSRSLSKSEAERLTGQVQRHLHQTDQILRSQHASTLDDVVRDRAPRPPGSHDTLAAQVQVVGEMVIRLFEGAGQDSSLVPAH